MDSQVARRVPLEWSWIVQGLALSVQHRDSLGELDLGERVVHELLPQVLHHVSQVSSDFGSRCLGRGFGLHGLRFGLARYRNILVELDCLLRWIHTQLCSGHVFQERWRSSARWIIYVTQRSRPQVQILLLCSSFLGFGALSLLALETFF